MFAPILGINVLVSLAEADQGGLDGFLLAP